MGLVGVVVALVAAGVALVVWSVWLLRRWRRPARGVGVGVIGLVSLMVSMLVVVGHVTESGEARPKDPHPESEFRLAVLGDSYTSGEGARRYFADTDEPRSNKCHRAASAFGYLAAEQLQASLAFIACSGARTFHVTGRPEPPGASMPSGDPKPQYPSSEEDVYGGRFQLEDLQRLDPAPDAVVMGIGGNDAGFGDIGQGCAIPTKPACQTAAQYWIDRLDKQVFPALVDAFEAVRSATDGPVFVTTYPNPLGPKPCRDVLLATSELSFLRDVFIPRLNVMVTFAAAVAGVRVIDLEHAMDGHRICEVPLSKAAVNFISLGRTRGSTLELSLDGIRSLGHGTFHPNERGHRLLLEPVVQALRDATAGTLPELPPPPPPGITPPPYVPSEVGPPTGPYPFPSGTECSGSEVVRVEPVGAAATVKRIDVSGAKPRSTVCFRSYQGTWRAATVDTSGEASVSIDVGAAGIGSVNEVLIQRTDRSWRKLVVQNLGDPAPDGWRAVPFWVALPACLVLIAAFVALLVYIRRRGSVPAAPK